jgi:predicted dehydrogenase
MTQEDVIRLAREAGLHFLVEPNWMFHEQLEAFAKLVAEKEREACALICENYGDEAFVDGRINADHHAYLIRQRGQA